MDIIVLGGGYAGVLTAKKLAKSIKKQKKGEQIKLTLIDKNPFHTMLTELHEVAANRVGEESIKMDLKKIFAGRDVKIVIDNIENIDFAKNTLKGKNGSYKYDYLVVGSGSKPAFFGTAGAAENSYTLWSFDNAVRLRDHILANFREAEKESRPEVRKELLTFYVVGGGFTGAEMMGELSEWVPFLCRDYHIDPKEVKMVLVDMLDRIITSLPEKYAKKAEKRLIKKKVEISVKTKVCGVDPDGIILEKDNKKVKYPSRTVIWTAGIEGSQVVQTSSIEKTRGSRIETNEYLQSKQYNNVYIVGDNIFFIPEGEKTSVPQMVENCEASAKYAAINLMADITKQGEKQKYAPKFHGMMVCIGGRWGTAYVGTHTKKFGLPSFFAMFSKHFINIIYFVQVLGWNKVYNYILHEILQIRNNRSFVGGYLSNYSPNFWSVPLRMFLGFSWLKEGIDKLPKILEDFNNVYSMFGIPKPGEVDAVTAVSALPGGDLGWQADLVAEAIIGNATQAAQGLDANAAQIVIDQAKSAAEQLLAHNTVAMDTVIAEVDKASRAALPVPGFITDMVNWMMSTFISPIAPAFGTGMVLMEIIIGLCFLGGLFTAPVAVVSAVMCVMIYTTGMSYDTIIWYFMAAIALIGIGGTGQTFALDYYVLPWLKKIWNKINFVKKWYIYND